MIDNPIEKYPIVSRPGEPVRRLYIPPGIEPAAYLAMVEQSKRMVERFKALYEDPNIFSLRSEVAIARLVVENTLNAVAKHHAKTGMLPAEATSALLTLMREVADLVERAAIVERQRSPEERYMGQVQSPIINIQNNLTAPDDLPLEEREVRFRLIGRDAEGAPSLLAEELALKAQIATLQGKIDGRNGSNGDSHVATG